MKMKQKGFLVYELKFHKQVIKAGSKRDIYKG